MHKYIRTWGGGPHHWGTEHCLLVAAPPFSVPDSPVHHSHTLKLCTTYSKAILYTNLFYIYYKETTVLHTFPGLSLIDLNKWSASLRAAITLDRSGCGHSEQLVSYWRKCNPYIYLSLSQLLIQSWECLLVLLPADSEWGVLTHTLIEGKGRREKRKEEEGKRKSVICNIINKSMIYLSPKCGLRTCLRESPVLTDEKISLTLYVCKTIS